jgi:hypothetical protein
LRVLLRVLIDRFFSPTSYNSMIASNKQKTDAR